MIRAGFVHTEGRYAGQPNVRRFAKRMADKDGHDREVMERNVRRWIDEEDPTGPTSAMRERAAEVFREAGLEIEPDDLRLKRAFEALVQRRQETDSALEELTREVGLLAQQVQELRCHVQALQREAGGHEPEP